MFLQPGSTAGTCPAPANGGSTNVGCTFVLDLMLNAGSNPDVTAHQSYLTYTSSIIQNARVSNIGTSCVLTNTVTADLGNHSGGFDAVLQNEVCNGPNPCTFRGVTADAGSIAYSSCALSNVPQGGVFRVARIGLCASSPGAATIHWQFSPPAPITRDTQIVSESGELISNPSLFADYVINVVNPASLVSHVNWQGHLAQPNALQQLPITLTLKSGSTEMDYPSVNTDANGYFTVSVGSLPNGTYNWRVKGPKFLADAGNVTLSGSMITSAEMGLMRVGDANDDNVVNITDFNLMRNSFGKGVGEPGYDDRADFNGDARVSVVDVNLHKNNMGTSGAPPISPGNP